MSLKFQRKIEDFTCLNCGKGVKGNGYTNHCPHCLWGKHVDIHPGDRLNPCQGAMKPIGVELKQGHYLIVHECQKCGQVTRFKAGEGDKVSDYLSSML